MGRRFSHWKPRYILNRITLIAYERTHPESPWLTRTMIEILASWLRPEDRGLEWGSGRSTVWFAQRVNHLISIEHDESWYRRIETKVKEKGLGNVDYRFYRNPSEYISVSEQLPRESLDFVLVDGVVRDKCALAAIPILKQGGILIIDNCNWYLPCESYSPGSRDALEGAASEEWESFLHKVTSWRRVWTTNGITDTTLWVKKAK